MKTSQPCSKFMNNTCAKGKLCFFSHATDVISKAKAKAAAVKPKAKGKSAAMPVKSRLIGATLAYAANSMSFIFTPILDAVLSRGFYYRRLSCGA